MKKIFLMFAMIFMFAACGGNKEAAQKVYVVGTNAEYPPFEYVENGEIAGFDAEIIKEAAKRMGIEYKWLNTNFDGLIPALQTKKVDIVIAGMSVTPEREKAVNFSIPYLTSNVAIVTNSKNPIKNMNDLSGKSYGVELGTTKEASARKIDGAEVVPFSSTTGALVALKSGKIDGMVLDESVSSKYIEKNPELVLVGVMEGEPKAAAFNKDDKELMENFSKVLEEMITDGTVAELREKYKI
ncbi:basic amino acid ABC transporter substrate-binding protein [Fusobacterium sp. SB021]|uniref:basic amino acid ABC transporter substrate-binding protein n=1 Tax=Fusobacterium sp. SB021 TaxID=2744227 RepID=UPI003CEDED25